MKLTVIPFLLIFEKYTKQPAVNWLKQNTVTYPDFGVKVTNITIKKCARQHGDGGERHRNYFFSTRSYLVSVLSLEELPSWFCKHVCTSAKNRLTRSISIYFSVNRSTHKPWSMNLDSTSPILIFAVLPTHDLILSHDGCKCFTEVRLGHTRG